ncbi:hypothetical protein D3C80_457220 [compost metagenome]
MLGQHRHGCSNQQWEFAVRLVIEDKAHRTFTGLLDLFNPAHTIVIRWATFLGQNVIGEDDIIHGDRLTVGPFGFLVKRKFDPFSFRIDCNFFSKQPIKGKRLVA